MYYRYDVTIHVTKELCGQYKPYHVTFKSPVQLADRAIRTEAINRIPDDYVSFGVMYKTEKRVDE